MKPPSYAAGSTVQVDAQSVDGSVAADSREVLAVEEPLGIRVLVEEGGRRRRHDVAITMRTPGQDRELALGFLFTEGILAEIAEVADVRECESDVSPGSVVEVSLVPGVSFDAERFRRNVYTSSSCGICGRAAIERVRLGCEPFEGTGPRIDRNVLWSLPTMLREAQAVFERTGGLHAAGWFDPLGELLRAREDVGRHNAVDKVIGSLLEGEGVPASEGVLMVSGRASFELVQKAALAGMPILAAVGAPSSLAVELGDELGMTIIGFLRDERCNVYTGSSRIVGAQ